MSAAFTREPVEWSGRTEGVMSAAFTREPVEWSGRTVGVYAKL